MDSMIVVDIRWNLTKNEAGKASAHWLQWEQNLSIKAQMAEFIELPAVCAGSWDPNVGKKFSLLLSWFYLGHTHTECQRQQ